MTTLYPITIRDLDAGERAWARAQYQAIRFAPSPSGSVAMVAERAGQRVGLGRLVSHEVASRAPAAVELGGIWTAEAARGAGVARAMVTALLARWERIGQPGPLWCIPFTHLTAFYGSFGFATRPAPWPQAIAAKVAVCIAQALPEVVVLAR